MISPQRVGGTQEHSAYRRNGVSYNHPVHDSLPHHGALRVVGLIGAVIVAFGGWRGGALPSTVTASDTVVILSNAAVFVGAAILVAAWLAMGPRAARGDVRESVTTFLWWSAPLVATAPLFSQDVYSYLAQGAAVNRGLDPFSAGPVTLLGRADPLTQNVPKIWSDSPSPYGPVALGVSAAISVLSGDDVHVAIIMHRLVAIAALLVCAWALAALARRCDIAPASALWLGLLNPLVVLHLVGGMHNEAIMLAFMLAGLELGLRALDSDAVRSWALFATASALISCAGLVKISGFIALGFTGMALARVMRPRLGIVPAVGAAALFQLAVLWATAVVVAALAHTTNGWLFVQGGAAEIRSWLSMTTEAGIMLGNVGEWLGLGDHTDGLISFTRGLGFAIAVAFMLRMLFETLNGKQHPVRAFGLSTLVLVALLPVVQPWYPLWAIPALAASERRAPVRAGLAVFSAAFCFVVLPLGSSIEPNEVAVVYSAALGAVALITGMAWLWFRPQTLARLH